MFSCVLLQKPRVVASAVETRFGGEAALKNLVSAVHDQDMKVLADFDPKIFEKWTDRTSEITPMPIFGSFTG